MFSSKSGNRESENVDSRRLSLERENKLETFKSKNRVGKFDGNCFRSVPFAVVNSVNVNEEWMNSGVTVMSVVVNDKGTSIPSSFTRLWRDWNFFLVLL